MNESLWTFGFEVANFVGLAGVLAWLFFNPLRKALEDEQARRQQLEDEAAKKLYEAERASEEINNRRAQLESDLQGVRSQAEQAAKAEAQRLIAQVREQLERERAEAQRNVAHLQQSQSARLAMVVAAAARSTVQQLLQKLDGPELEQLLIEAACRELQSFTGDIRSRVVVITASTLNPLAEQSIRTSLGNSEAEFRVDPSLIGGLKISTNAGLINASILGLAEFAEQCLSREMECMIREGNHGK